MDHLWTVTIWGTRGAVPMARQEFLEFGGSTSCVSVTCNDQLAVFDAGTGIVELGKKLAALHHPPVLHLFISHLHLDHIIGLTGFQTLYDPNAKVHIYGEPRDGKNILQQIARVLGPPFWPVGPDNFQANITVHDLKPGQHVNLPNGLTVDTLRANHPNLCLLYRLEGNGKRLVYALDCEMSHDMDERLAFFARDADLLIWDANFIPGEIKPDWGHSSWEQGSYVGQLARAKTVLMTHFSHWYDDSTLRQQEEVALAADLAVRFARERMVITL